MSIALQKQSHVGGVGAFPSFQSEIDKNGGDATPNLDVIMSSDRSMDDPMKVENANATISQPSLDVRGQFWDADSGYSLEKEVEDDSSSSRDGDMRSRNLSSSTLDSAGEGSPVMKSEDDDSLVICEERDYSEKVEKGKVASSGAKRDEENECNYPIDENAPANAQDTALFDPVYNSTKEAIINLNGFSQYFPHNLHTLHRRQLFCDVTIRAHETIFHAHKIVLAACSPYFYNALEKNQAVDKKDDKESRSTSSFVDLGTSVSPTGLGAVIDCMYSSAIVLRHDTVQDIFNAATYLDMQLVVDACYKFLQSRREIAINKQNAGSSATKEEDDKIQHLPESAMDLTAVAKQGEEIVTHTDKTRDSNCDLEGSDSGRGRATSSEDNTTPDPDGDTIYQTLSSQNDAAPKSSSPKSVNWKKHKYITQNRSEPTMHDDIVDEKTASAQPRDATQPRDTCEDDEVFMKNEAVRQTQSATADSGISAFASTHRSLMADDLIRRHQRDLYRHMLVNSPYVLNPEAMAAAVAMTSLTSPLRSPTGRQDVPVTPSEQSRLIMNPWHHILGQRMQHTIPGSGVHCPPRLNSLPRISPLMQPANFLSEQKARQQALLSLAGHRYIPHPMPNEQRPEIGKTETVKNPSPHYNPLLLSNLLQAGGPTSSTQCLKRSYSATSNEGSNENRTQEPSKRFSSDRPVFGKARDSNQYLASIIKNEIENRQQKKRRSTSSTSGSPDRPYKCLVCAAEFNRPANLKTHMRIHSGEKPYKCQSCGARFVQVAHLRAHILIHTGEKPYPCDVCGTRFRHLQTLKSHLRIHTGEKPYACDECQVRFRHKSQLRLHLRTKHGINTNTKKTYQQVPGLKSADISAHIKRTQEAVRMQSHRKDL